MPIGATAYGRAKQRHNTAANLASANPVPAAGEFIAALDGTALILRMGDGATHWNDLPDIYPNGGGGGGGGAYIEADGPTPPSGQPDGTIWYNTSPAV